MPSTDRMSLWNFLVASSRACGAQHTKGGEQQGLPRENRHFFLYFWDFSGPRKKWAQMGPNGARRIFFRLIQTLSTFWAERILILRICIFLDFFGSQISKFPGPRFPNFQKSGLGPAWAHLGPGLGPGLQVPWCLKSKWQVPSGSKSHLGRTASRRSRTIDFRFF